MTEVRTATPGLGPLRSAPAGMPDTNVRPPTIAESGDPFTALRVVGLLARIERGAPVRLVDIADRLNAAYTDWIFPTEVVADDCTAHGWTAHGWTAHGWAAWRVRGGPGSADRSPARSTSLTDFPRLEGAQRP